MIEEAWNEYRGWTKRAHALQTSAQRSSRTAFLCSGLAAILGTAAAQVTSGSVLSRALAFATAVLAANTQNLEVVIFKVAPVCTVACAHFLHQLCSGSPRQPRTQSKRSVMRKSTIPREGKVSRRDGTASAY